MPAEGCSIPAAPGIQNPAEDPPAPHHQIRTPLQQPNSHPSASALPRARLVARSTRTPHLLGQPSLLLRIVLHLLWFEPASVLLAAPRRSPLFPGESTPAELPQPSD